MAQPLDAGRLELAGEPFPVAEQVDADLDEPLPTDEDVQLADARRDGHVAVIGRR